MKLTYSKKDVADYKKVEDLNELPQDRWFYCVLCRRRDHETLEAAVADGAEYELKNQMNRTEAYEGMYFAETAARMFDDNYGGINLYICEATS